MKPDPKCVQEVLCNLRAAAEHLDRLDAMGGVADHGGADLQQ
jgi:hypothetical protein